jgi:hypothetical protein
MAVPTRSRNATAIGALGTGVALLLAGAVLSSGNGASAATTCASSQPTATATATSTSSASASPTPVSTENAQPGLLDSLPPLLPLSEGQDTTSPTPSSTASATATSSPTAMPKTTVTLAPRRVVKGDPVRVTGTGVAGCKVQLIGKTRPATTNKVLRTATVADNGRFALDIYPPANTDLYAKSENASASTLTSVNVRFILSMKITRTAVKTLHFEGGVAPGRSGVAVDVFRSTGSRYTKVGTAKTLSNGTWSLTHAFGGTGRFTFYALVNTTTDNDSNRSPLVQATIS